MRLSSASLCHVIWKFYDVSDVLSVFNVNAIRLSCTEYIAFLNIAGPNRGV